MFSIVDYKMVMPEHNVYFSKKKYYIQSIEFYGLRKLFTKVQFQLCVEPIVHTT